MAKKKSILFSAIALSTLVLGAGAGLTSCGPTEEPLSYRWEGSADNTSSKVELDLDPSLVVSAKDSTYFAPYVVDLNDDGSYRFISSGGDTLMESGESAKLLAYWVPENFTLFASARNAADGSPVNGVVSADGTVTAPSVSEKTDLIITLSAVSNEPIVNPVNGGEPVVRHLKEEVNLTVVPSGSIARDMDAVYRVLTETERNQLTAQLETYAMEHGLTGIRFQSNGGQALYRDRFSTPVLEADNYIPSYGWGTNQYGTINAPLDAETNEAYKMYYHSIMSPNSELGTINYLDSDQAAVNTLYAYIASSFWGYNLNEDYTNTEHSNVLARAEPEAVNPDEEGIATKWKVKVWVGGDAIDEEHGVLPGLNFRTNSEKYSQFDNRPITLEDYVTPIKLMATGAIGWYRGDEAANSNQGKTKLVGFTEYYNATAEATSLGTNEDFLSKVGVELNHEDNSITFEFEQGFDQDFAKYYLDALWANPMNEEFMAAIGDGNAIAGAKVYGTSPEGENPADTTLSVGPYMLEKYTPQVEVVFKKNDTWPVKLSTDAYGRTMYQIPGFYMRVDSALLSDQEEAMKQFEAGYTDSVTIATDTQYEKYATDPRLRTVLPDGTFGTTFNRMDKALWDSYFGPGGNWYQAFNPDGVLTANKQVNPVLSNDNYFKALNLGFDRAAYAEAEHDGIYYEYFQPGQKVNPVTDVYYNDTEEHKAAMKEVYGDAFDDPANSPQFAVQYMQDAIIEELDAGHLDLGEAGSPTNFGFTSSIISSDNYFRILNYYNEYIGNVFNEAVSSYVDGSGNNPLLSNGQPLVSFTISPDEYSADASGQNALLGDVWAGVSNSQSVFSISGNTLDSIDYLDILSCNKIAGFELSFAVDTNVPSAYLEWDDKYWSFESLWWAASGGGVTIDENGRGSSSAAA